MCQFLLPDHDFPSTVHTRVHLKPPKPCPYPRHPPRSSSCKSPTVFFDDAGFFAPLCDLGGAPSPAPSASDGSLMGSEEGDINTSSSLCLPKNLPFQRQSAFDAVGRSSACCANGGGGGGGSCGRDCPFEDALRGIVKEITRGGQEGGDTPRADMNLGLVSAAAAAAAVALVATTAASTSTSNTGATSTTALSDPGPAYSPAGSLPPRGILEKQRQREQEKPTITSTTFTTSTTTTTTKKRGPAGSNKKKQALVSKKTKAKEQQQQQQRQVAGQVRKSNSGGGVGGTKAFAEGSKARKVSRASAGAGAGTERREGAKESGGTRTRYLTTGEARFF